MKKNGYRITESELKRMISESVMRIMNEIYNNSSWSKTDKGTREILFSIGDVSFTNPQLNDWVDNNFNELPTEDVYAEVSYTYTSYENDRDTAPAGDDFEIDDIVIKPNELIEFLKQQFEPEVFDVMINDIVTYVENNVDDLLQYEYDEPEPDWDEIRKERMLRDFENNNF